MIKHFDDITGEPTFLTCDFDEPVLYAPARSDSVHPCTSLKVITAFTDCERISTHMIKLAEGIKSNRFVKGLSIEILLGMTKSSLSQKKHEDICRMVGFLNSSKGMPKISCRYICNGPEVHSKVYVWTTPDDTVGELPQVAFCGSLNYTMNAFYKRRESVSMCSSIMAYRYYKELLPDTIDCFDPAVSEKLKKFFNAVQIPAEQISGLFRRGFFDLFSIIPQRTAGDGTEHFQTAFKLFFAFGQARSITRKFLHHRTARFDQINQTSCRRLESDVLRKVVVKLPAAE